MSALPEGHRIGPYRIIRLIGEGGMGAVYEARQESLDRRVALKTLHPKFAGSQDVTARFFNEAKVLSRLEHASIVQVSDFGTAADGTAYLVMEYLRGQSLGQRLRTGKGRFPVVTALQLAWQVADVLSVAHAEGVVHRDLKPDNLMLVQDPVAPGGERVKVLDFGIAKLTGTIDRAGVKTDTLAVMGTPMYMSPEQCTGAGGVDAKTDVYSLGCVLYQLLAGRPPFKAEGPGALIGMHLFQEPAALSSAAAPPTVAALVHRMLIKDKTQRPSMCDATAELGRLLGKLTSPGPAFPSRTLAVPNPSAVLGPVQDVQPTTTLGQSTGQRSKLATQRWRLIIASLGCLGLVGASAMAWHRHTPAGAAIRIPPVVVIKTAPAGPPEAVPLQVAPLAPKLVVWTLDSRPVSATILDEAGQEIGTTPWTQQSPAEPGTKTLRINRQGYSEVTVQLDRAADSTQVVRLKRLAAIHPPRSAEVRQMRAPVPPPSSTKTPLEHPRLPHEN